MLLEAYPDPKPANTTVATLLKRMTEKGYVGYNEFGRSREYFPKVKKSDYFSQHVNGLISKFFNNSASQFASFFTTETGLSKKELEDLKGIIEKQIREKQS
jgi:predicted transcriptional regulator